jgi:hypothetical protein
MIPLLSNEEDLIAVLYTYVPRTPKRCHVIYVYLDCRMIDELKSGRKRSWPNGGMNPTLA